MKKLLTNTVIFLIIAIALVLSASVAQHYFNLKINGNAGLFLIIGYILGMITSSLDYSG